MGLAWIFLTGCTILQELQESNLKRQQETRVRMKDRYVTFEAPDDTGVNVSGTPGSPGAFTQITVDSNTPDILYYQCLNHPHIHVNGSS